MIATLLEWVYYGFKAIGLFDKLLAVHRAKEVQNAQTSINSLDDAAVDKRLRSEYERID